MERVPVERIVRDAQKVIIDPNDSYVFSYPHFVRYLEHVDTIGPTQFVIAAHFTYGWMPRVLLLKPQHVPAAAAILNSVKHGQHASREQLELMKVTLRNSLVAASKLLHFANPDGYAIWDSRVYGYITGRVYSAQVSKIENYITYIENCQEIIRDPRFKAVHASVNAQTGYSVSPLRAVELVMFLNGRRG